MSTDDLDHLWGGVKQSIHSRIEPEQFDIWVSSTRLLDVGENSVLVEVPDELHAAYLSDNLTPHFQDALEAATGLRRPIKFTVNHDPQPALQQPELFGQDELGAPAETEVKKRDGRPPQPAVGCLNESYIFTNFVVGASNEFAAAACQAVAKNPARAYNPLFLFGGTGLGKTHLMHAIAAEMLVHRPKAKIVCISCEDFINDFIAAIQNNTLPEFRKRYRNADVLLIDDVHLLAGKERSQEEFFHTFNKFHDGHKQIVLTCDTMPSEINGLEKRLLSRFEWGMTAALTPPDVETRVAILRKKLQTMKASPMVPDAVVRFVAEKVRSNVRRLHGAILRVVTFHSLNPERPLTVELVADEILADLLHDEAREILTVEKVIRRVAEYYDLRVNDLTGTRRPANIAWARQVAMHLTRELTKASYQDIGEAFGGRDHGTVMHACKVVSKRCREDEKANGEVRFLQKELQR